MNPSRAAPPRVLVVGGLGGQLGRALATELRGRWTIRTLHRHPVASETAAGTEWRSADAGGPIDWGDALAEVDALALLAWHRTGSRHRFERLGAGLARAVDAARRYGVRSIVHVSVPPAPSELELHLPYLVEKRKVDRAVEASGVPYTILRPSALFGSRDVLLSVMMRTAHRYGRLPLFGDGAYHLSPVASSDVARAVRCRLETPAGGTEDVGGPERFEFRTLTDVMFAALGRAPRYWRLSDRGGVRLARLLELLGSSLLYAYEVEWLLSDRLGVAPYAALDRPLTSVRPYLAELATTFGRPSPSPTG